MMHGFKKVKPVYLELCSKNFFSKMFARLTQNANECSNGIIWQRVLKDVFVCLSLLKLGAHHAVIQFNESYHGAFNFFSKIEH